MIRSRCLIRSLMSTPSISTSSMYKYRPVPAPCVRMVQTTGTLRTPQMKGESTFDLMGGWKMKMKRKLGLLAISKNTLAECSRGLYEGCTDRVPIELFFKEFNLPDTFYGWFLVTELHVWMMMCRCMRDGKEGFFLRNQIVTRMWEDSNERLKLLGNMGAKERSETMEELSQHFQACVISYDEGLLTDDKTLAAAIWRILFTYECDDPRHLDRLVQYVRTQMDHLISVERDEFLINGTQFEWAHFEPFHVS